MHKSIALVALLGFVGAVSAADKPMSDQLLYGKMCGICHLEAGQGIPGAFPPLDARLAEWAATDGGQAYLVNVMVNGLYGPIDVNGVSYVGAMPGLADQLSSEEIAGLLNFVLVTFAGGEAVFDTARVDDLRAANGRAQSSGLRPK